jgi:uncharacterized protein (TIGR00255 family)
VQAWAAAYGEVKAAFTLPGSAARELDIFALMRMEGVVCLEKADAGDQLWQDLRLCLTRALAAFARVRAHDGEAARRDLEKQLRFLEAKAGNIKKRARRLVPEYGKELEKRLTAMAGKKVDSALILTEAAVIASRSDVNEELVRLLSHIALFRGQMKAAAPAGRTLDFIAQEMQREINTIGSKQTEIEISTDVIAMKAALEKIREQVRNVE